MAAPHQQQEVIFVLVGLLLLLFSQKATCVYLQNVNCGSYPDVVPTDSLAFRYHPIYVKVNRCKGANVDGLAASKTCIPDPKKCQNIEIDVINMHTQRHEILTLLNETDCVYRCNLNHTECSVFENWNEDTCRCDCRFVRGDEHIKPPLCPPNRYWNFTQCKCVCMEKEHAGGNGCEPVVVPNKKKK